GLEGVGRAGVGGPVAELRHVAGTGGGAALGRALQIGGAVDVHPVAALGQVTHAGRGAALGARGHHRIGRAVVAGPVAALGDVAHPGRGAALGAGRLLRVGRAVGAGPVTGLGRVAGASRGPAHRPGVAGRMLTRVAAAVAGAGRAGVAVVGAGRAAGLLCIRGAHGTRSRAVLCHVALARRGATYDARRLEAVGRARIARPVAGLGHVAHAGGGPADGARGLLRVGRAARTRPGAELRRVTGPGRGAALRACGDEAVGRAVVPRPVAALGHVADAGRGPALIRALRIRRTVGTRARARLGQVAGACRRTAHHARRHEPVRGAVVGHPVTALGDVASTDRFATYRRALLVLGAVRIEPVAEFRDIAHTGRGATEGAGVARRMLTLITAAIADVGRAGVAVVGAHGPVRQLGVGRAVDPAARAELRNVALARRRAALGGGQREGIGRAIITRSVAALGDVAHPGRHATLGAGSLLRVGRAVGTGPVAGLRRVAGARRCAAYRAAVASRMLASRARPVALVERARVAVVGAGRAARLHGIRRAGGAGAGAVLRHVALAGRRAAHGARGLEG